jgi:hypothetical protein
MIIAVASDAVFFTALFFEALAVLTILHAAHAIEIQEAFEPILAFYHDRALPVIALGARLLPGNQPPWFASAYVISAVLFYLFFIEQARRAMAPFPLLAPDPSGDKPTPVETALDEILPVGVCALGAFMLAATLLPVATVPLALWIGARGLQGNPTWFNVSRGYYVNLLILGAFVFLALAWPGRFL